MPVEVRWDDEAQTILWQIYTGHIALKDYYTVVDEVERMAKTVSHTVHSVFDRSAIVTTPSMILPALSYANSHVPPNLDLRVIVRPGMMTRTAVEIGRLVAPRLVEKVQFALTMDQARVLIAKYAAKNTPTA